VARIISVSNHKGGVGKTTITANLGFSLARYYKILLVDLDPQGNLSSGLGFLPSEENLGKYFKEVIHFRSPVVKPTIINEYVHIIPSNIDLIKIENQLKDTVRGESVLKEILLPLKSKYDLIILDCPPSFNFLTMNALRCSNLILVPAKPEVFSMYGINLLKNFAEENGIPFKIIFNQVNIRSLFHRKMIRDAKEKFNGKLLGQTIRNTISLAEAFSHARDIFQYKSTSAGAFDFTSVADELMPYI
jgi:chromosome partitioning protein